MLLSIRSSLLSAKYRHRKCASESRAQSSSLASNSGKDHPCLKGFTLIELMIALAIMAILLTMAVSGWRVWIINGHIRTVSGNIADNLRATRATALQRNRRVTFQLCDKDNDTSEGTVPVTAIITLNPIDACEQTIPSAEDAGLGQAGGSGDSSTAALAHREIITGGSARIKAWSSDSDGKWSVTFNPLGRAVSYPSSDAPDPGNEPLTFEIDSTVSDANGIRPMRVLVYESGRILVCDTKVSNSADPRACPA